MLEVHKLSKSFDGEALAVERVSFTVREGELVALVGRSGCGKTTTLKMLNRLIELTSGHVYVNGTDHQRIAPEQLRRQIGYVFQGIGLFPHMTVRENVACVPELLGWSRDAVGRRVAEVLEQVSLEPSTYADRFPNELSGGQQQRVGLARALAARPGIMLMDEPFAALDPLTRETLQQQYLDLHQAVGVTSILVTHDMTEALLMADRVAVMEAGRLLQFDTPARLMRHPAAAAVDQLLAMPRRQMEQLEALHDSEQG